jgi:hypothetical protein
LESWLYGNRDKEEPKKGAKKESQKRETKFQHHLFPIFIQSGSEVDIKPYQGEIDVVKLNQWLQ